MSDIPELQRKSLAYRREILTIIKHANAGHTGGSLSCVDILNVLYNRVMNVSPDNFDSAERDRFIQSKGHSVEALYVVLADVGFFPKAELGTLNQYGSHFIGHPTRKVRGVEQNTGGLGHGLPVAVGAALAAKRDGRTLRVFTLLGDGELAEGSNWEALMSASHYQLDNLVAIVDFNGLQITDRIEKVTGLTDLAEKFRAFGCAVRCVDGNDVGALVDVLEAAPFEAGKPNLILAQTLKGKGISFMEDQKQWHHKVPSDDQFATAMAELDTASAQLESTHAIR